DLAHVVARPQLTADHARPEQDDDAVLARVVEVRAHRKDPVESDLQTGLLPDLAHGGDLEVLVVLDEPGREVPVPLPWLVLAPGQQPLAVVLDHTPGTRHGVPVDPPVADQADLPVASVEPTRPERRAAVVTVRPRVRLLARRQPVQAASG